MGLSLFTACESDDETPVLKEPASFVLNTPAYANTLYDLENSTSMEFTCSQPDYGYTAAVNYTVQVSLTNDFTTEGAYTTMSTSYPTAKFNQDVIELAAACTELSGKEEDEFPYEAPVYIRLKASLVSNGEGVVYSNVVTLPKVRLYYALPPVLMPTTMYLNGSMCSEDWNWGSAFPMVLTYDNNGTFWRLVYVPANGEMKFNTNKAWDGNDFGASATLVDNAGAELSGDNNIIIANAGWYIVVVRTVIEGRDYKYTVEFNEPKVYLCGPATKNANGEMSWGANDNNLFTVPSEADAEFVSPAFTAEALEADGGVRACVIIGAEEWWHSEFIVLDGILEYRATGGDQTRVLGKPGQKLYINFTKGTGQIK